MLGFPTNPPTPRQCVSEPISIGNLRPHRRPPSPPANSISAPTGDLTLLRRPPSPPANSISAPTGDLTLLRRPPSPAANSISAPTGDLNLRSHRRPHSPPANSISAPTGDLTLLRRPPSPPSNSIFSPTGDLPLRRRTRSPIPLATSLSSGDLNLRPLRRSPSSPATSIPPPAASISSSTEFHMQCLNARNLVRAVHLLPTWRRLFARDVSTKLFIGGLSYDTNETVLKDAFDEHGGIMQVKVLCYRRSGESRGYGFIQFSLESEATSALEKMDGQMLDGRKIRVQYANKG